MNDNIIRYYTGAATDGEIHYAAKIRGTVVCASYPDCPYNRISLHAVAQLLTKQVVKAHILESIPDVPAEELYQAVVHVAEGVRIPSKVKWNSMHGEYKDVSDFADAVKRRTK